jgi:hypothetical protein
MNRHEVTSQLFRIAGYDQTSGVLEWRVPPLAHGTGEGVSDVQRAGTRFIVITLPVRGSPAPRSRTLALGALIHPKRASKV